MPRAGRSDAWLLPGLEKEFAHAACIPSLAHSLIRHPAAWVEARRALTRLTCLEKPISEAACTAFSAMGNRVELIRSGDSSAPGVPK